MHTTKATDEIKDLFYKTVDTLKENLDHPDTPLFLVPYPQNTFLKNSDIWTAKIREAFSKGYQAAVCQAAAVGQGGIGKTAMAVEYAWKYSGEYPGGVFWLGMESGLTGAVSKFLQVAETKGLLREGWEDLDEKSQINLLLSQLQTFGKKLIILDNLETDQIPKKIFTISDSDLLVTTRNQKLAVPHVNMELPYPDTALDIFLGYAHLEKEKITTHDLSLIQGICKKVEFLPLALEIIGSLSRGYSLEKLAVYLPKELITRERPTCNKECTSILASLNLAGYQFSIPKTKEVLCSAAYFDPDFIDPELLADILKISSKQIYEILSNLTELSILKRTATGYGVHRIVQQAIIFLDDRITWGETVLQYIHGKINELMDKGQYIRGYGLIPHIVHIANMADKDQPEDEFPDNNELSTLGNYLERTGRYVSSETIILTCLKRVEKAKGPDHPSVAATLNNLAGLYESQGKYEEAEPLYQRALKIRETVLGPDHPSVATTLNNLAGLYESQGKYEEAEPLYQRALKITETVLGPDHPSVAATLNNLAGLYHSQGKYEEAEPLYQRALKIRETVLGPDHPSVATTLNNLAGLYESQGKYEEAEPLYQRALKIRETVLGPDHPSVATTLNNLAGLYESQGKYEEAEPLYQRALKIRETVLGPDHPSVATTLNNLAGLYESQGKYEEAEPLCQRALKIKETVLGPDHPSVATTLNNLAELYRSQGKYEEAEPLYQRALKILKAQLGKDHPNTKIVQRNYDKFKREKKI
ncbi:tetratricopeptide repeat protein [Desulfobacter hydrogenophilus]|uniref:tetratricopeptide repeat protein n=1 Tax=Desulfobacter hydrogenophilus TaxID=2291 RepID=UPI0013EFA514|nr:tetratricopeptide repeat protein [Desulfobacter hydrogenophilus]